MYLPNYHDGSIVNLMSSILRAFGGISRYNPLPDLPLIALSQTKNVVLLIIDGLGYDYVIEHDENTLFLQYLKQKLTSVFPATTATAIMTFFTGRAPQEHAMTGWFMYLKEVGAVSTVLPFQPRCCEMSLAKNGVRPEALWDCSNIFGQINRQCYVVTHKNIIESTYNRTITRYARDLPYTTLAGCMRQIKRIITSNSEKKFIHVYWADFDTLCHKHGTKSVEVTNHFKDVTKKLISLVKALAHTETTLIITADHGLIDAEPSKTIRTQDHPELKETLVLPLCGEPRVAYCYVRLSKTAQFEAYIKQHFSGMCDLYRSEDLIQNHYFGLFEPDQRLFERVGDYILIMRDNYIVRDYILGEEENKHIGVHGGVSKEEMFVPLILIDC